MKETSLATLAHITELINAYKPSESTKELVRRTPIMLLVGISGAGKDTMGQELLKLGHYQRLVTTTTRQPRQNQGVMEQDGVEYHFITLEDSLLKLQNGEYIEGNVYSGNVYGTTVSDMEAVLDSGKVGITDIDVNGVANYKQISAEVIATFILPPSFTEWQRRLASRYGQAGPDPADIKKRMHTAIGELEHALQQDYYHFIVNDDLSKAVHAADSIAHSNDAFNVVDSVVRDQANKLLEDLRSHVSSVV